MLDLDKNDYQTLRLMGKRGSRRDEVLNARNIPETKDLLNSDSHISLLDQTLQSRKSLEFSFKKWSSPRIRSLSSNRAKKSDEPNISRCNLPVSPMTRIRHKVLNFYGEVEGVKVGDWWNSRLECSYSGVHRPAFAGIHGGPDGAYSVALTGCNDYFDKGFNFIYSGSGYRDLRGNKDCHKNSRVATHLKSHATNASCASLMKNFGTGNPVRVIRGYKLNSSFAPVRGYRYDGLYMVEKFWTCKKTSGYTVIKFFMKRCEDQPPASWELELNHSKSHIHSTKQSPLESDQPTDDSVRQYQAISPQREYPSGESITVNKSDSFIDDNKENSTLNIADRLLFYDEFTDGSIISCTSNLLPTKRRSPRKSKTQQTLKKLCKRPVGNIEDASSYPGACKKNKPSELFKGFGPECYPRKMILLGFLIHDMQCKLTEKPT